MKPCEVKKYSDVFKLKKSLAESKASWILLDHEVHIKNQKTGEKSTGEVTLTKREMKQFVKWWLGQ